MVDINITRLGTPLAKLESELHEVQARCAMLERENAALRQFRATVLSLATVDQGGASDLALLARNSALGLAGLQRLHQRRL